MNVVYTHRAQNDLHDIYEYIAFTLLSPENAASTVRRIIETVRSLEQLPERNPLYGDEPWRSRGLRFAATRNYLIFYMVDSAAQTASVARILYGGRNIQNQLDQIDD